MGLDTRFGDDDYESAGNDCASTKRTITPTALTNIYNVSFKANKLSQIISKKKCFSATNGLGYNCNDRSND